MLTEFSSWTGRNGIILNYWHGNGSLLQTGCECVLNKSCAKILHETKCNCDSYLENMTDKGMLTSMENLPVKKLNYGGAFSSSSSIQFNLGPLVCSGKSKPYASKHLDIMKKQIEIIINANDIQKALIEKNQNRASQSVVLLIARSSSSERLRRAYTTTDYTTWADTRITTRPYVSTTMDPCTTIETTSAIVTQSERNPPFGYQNGQKS